MTVTVDTPQGPRSGSSVIESTISDGPGMGDASGIAYDLKGEAVAVDIGNGQTIFALLSDGGDPAGFHAHLLNKSLADGAVATPPLPRKYKPHEWAEERKAARRIKPKIILQPAYYPILVWFKNINDPQTIEKINPNNMAAAFNGKFKIDSITIQITNDKIEKNITKNLPWILKGGKKFDPGFRPVGIPLGNFTSLFTTEASQ